MGGGRDDVSEQKSIFDGGASFWSMSSTNGQRGRGRTVFMKSRAERRRCLGTERGWERVVWLKRGIVGIELGLMRTWTCLLFLNVNKNQLFGNPFVKITMVFGDRIAGFKTRIRINDLMKTSTTTTYYYFFENVNKNQPKLTTMVDGVL